MRETLSETEGVDPDARSANQGYSALDFAEWAHSQDVAGADAVPEFLRARQCAGVELRSGGGGEGDLGTSAACREKLMRRERRGAVTVCIGCCRLPQRGASRAWSTTCW